MNQPKHVLSLLIVVSFLLSGLNMACSNSAPVITHTLDSFDNCRMCHEYGVGNAPKFTANHAVRTNGQCRFCHSTNK
jgi:hypothetical protein